MRKILSALIILILACILVPSACASDLTDAPGTATHDAVVSLDAVWADEAHTPYQVDLMSADEKTVSTVSEIFDFVVEQGNRPVQYFPEETQQAVQEMLEDVDAESLHMTEFMRMHATSVEQVPTDLRILLLMDVDYQPDQLVVVLIGNMKDPENPVWKPVDSKVTQLGMVECLVPREMVEELNGADMLFSVLTVRKGARGGYYERYEERYIIEHPSKRAENGIRVIEIYHEAEEEPEPIRFELDIVHETKAITQEMARMRVFVVDDENPAINWLPQNRRDDMALQLGADMDLTTLLVYDYIPLETKNYNDTYGDAIAAFTFTTPYTVGQKVAAVVGLPLEDAVEDAKTSQMRWIVLRATVTDDNEISVVFDQQSLSGMGDVTGLLVIYCAPFENAQ